MNREEAKKKLEIFTAFANGEQIQCGGNNISDLNDFFSYGESVDNYRIKPEPEVIYVNKPFSGAGSPVAYLSAECARLKANNAVYRFVYVAKKFIEAGE